MLKPLKAYDLLMSMLPGDGSKTVVAMGVKMLLPVVGAHMPFLLPLMPSLEEGLNLAIAAFLAHKGVKMMVK